MLTKEEIIILRTIFLEFGDEELRQKRLEFPYENLEIEGYERAEGSHRKANLGVLIDDLKPFERSGIDDIVFNFHLMGGAYTIGSDVPDVDRLVIVEGKQHGVDWGRDEEGIELRDSMISLKNHSKTDFFIYLRMGLYYKNIPNYEKAVEHLEAARQEYRKTFFHVVNQATENLIGFLDKHYDFERKRLKDSFVPGQDYPKTVGLPTALLCTIEEMPSFHLGEVFLDHGEELSRIGKASEAEDLLRQAKRYLEESEQAFGCIFYDHDSDSAPIVPSILRELEIITFPAPQVFQRNYYFERNLELLRGKSYPVPKTETEWIQTKEELINTLKQPEEKLKNVKRKIQIECEKKYSFWEALAHRTTNFVVEGLHKAGLGYWSDAIMALSKALEYELTQKLLKKIPDNIKQNFKIRKLLKIGDFKKIVENPLGKNFLKLNSYNGTNLSQSLNTVNNIRGETSAHPLRDPTQKDYETVKRILLEQEENRSPLLQLVLNISNTI